MKLNKTKKFTLCLFLSITFLIFNILFCNAQIEKQVKPCNVGITLSGGAARGIAHIGVLKAFEEAGIEINYISGSSIGAVVGLFYAAGKTPDEMLSIATKINKRRLLSVGTIHFRKRGIAYIEQIITTHISEKTFEQLKIPLFVCVTNVQSGQFEIIDNGNFLPAICASVSIPFLYKQQIINEVGYIDGGIVNNLPVEPVRDSCNIVVGVSVNPIEFKNEKLKLRKHTTRVIELMLNENEIRRKEMCDFHIEIVGIGEVYFTDFQYSQKIHDMGYRAAKEFIEKNPELFKLKNLNIN